jgi:hypothetical protein
MSSEVGVQVDVEVGVEVGVSRTPTSLLSLCTKGFQKIQVGVGLILCTSCRKKLRGCHLMLLEMPCTMVRDAF